MTLLIQPYPTSELPSTFLPSILGLRSLLNKGPSGKLSNLFFPSLPPRCIFQPGSALFLLGGVHIFKGVQSTHYIYCLPTRPPRTMLCLMPVMTQSSHQSLWMKELKNHSSVVGFFCASHTGLAPLENFKQVKITSFGRCPLCSCVPSHWTLIARLESFAIRVALTLTHHQKSPSFFVASPTSHSSSHLSPSSRTCASPLKSLTQAAMFRNHINMGETLIKSPQGKHSTHTSAHSSVSVRWSRTCPPSSSAFGGRKGSHTLAHIHLLSKE